MLIKKLLWLFPKSQSNSKRDPTIFPNQTTIPLEIPKQRMKSFFLESFQKSRKALNRSRQQNRTALCSLNKKSCLIRQKIRRSEQRKFPTRVGGRRKSTGSQVFSKK